MRIRAPHVIAFGLLVLAAASCSATTAYITDSAPATRAIAVDGRSDDWVGALSVVKDGKAEEGFLNDQNVLYVCFATGDESLRRQIADGGLTVWIDPKGGDAKTLGIRYPLARLRRQRPVAPQGEAPPQGEASTPPPASEETAADEASVLEILRSGSSAVQKMKISDAKDLEIAASEESGLFVYELKIPLQSSPDRPLALSAAPGAKVGIGFEVPKSERAPGSGHPGGGMGGRGGGMGGGMGRGGFGGGGGHMGGHGMGGGMGHRDIDDDSLKGMKVWTYVKLAATKSLSAARPLQF